MNTNSNEGQLHPWAALEAEQAADLEEWLNKATRVQAQGNPPQASARDSAAGGVRPDAAGGGLNLDHRTYVVRTHPPSRKIGLLGPRLRMATGMSSKK